MNPAALLAEGVRLQQQGALAEAADRFAELLRLEPKNADALYRLAQVSCQQSRFEAGVELARRSLAIDPRRARVHLLLGMALARLGRPQEALESFDRALTEAHDLADAHGNRGDALAALGRQSEAVASYERALAIAPDSIDNWCNRGAALHELRHYDEALASYDRAIALKPDFAQVHFNRGNALALLGRPAEALAAYDRALAIDPAYLDALNARGAALLKLKRYAEAVACFERMLALDPRHPRALGELAHCQLVTCDWEGAARWAGELKRYLADDTSIVSPFVVLGLTVGPAVLTDCTKRFVAHSIPRRQPMVSRRGRPDRDRICVAYLSADFRSHATAFLAAGLFEQHDRSRFEVIGVSFGADDGSAMRARQIGAFDQFHDVAARGDREIAELLQELGVDIAVDLKGHTEDARPGILAYRPAPVQAAYLGYPGPLGLEVVDYVIADKVVLPFEQQPFYSEKIVHLPDSYQVNDAKRPIAARVPARGGLGLPERAMVFCCFNHSWKISPDVFDIWMRLLRSSEGSVLWLLQTNEPASANLRKEARARGVDPQRLVFAPVCELPEHLARIACADLFLDTLPCNAHTTASDALWAGVPVLTCMGDTFAGRVAASLLHAVDLSDLVIDDFASYEALALKLATQPALRRSLRERLERNRSRCALFDTARFTRHIESAYTTMWEIAQHGDAPRGFTVDPIET